MKQISFACVVLIAGGLISCSPDKPSLVYARIDSVMNTTPDFSGVILVADQGKPVYFKSFGYLDFQMHTKLDTNAVFELASVSKQFTAMTIMMLQEEGKLNYDDSLKLFFPELPYPGITIRHLLNHTSGLPDYQSVMDQYWDKSKVAGNKECIEYLTKYHPPKEFEPGTQYQYSNTGYLLLASITEKVSGQDFISFVQQRIFQPVGMASTNIRTKEEKLSVKNFAWGHIFVEEKNQFIAADSFPSSNYTIWLGNRKGPGRISSTAADLLKWDQALYTGKLISEKSLTEAFTPAKLKNDSLSNYGFGWMIRQTEIGKVVRHSGDNPGYKTHIVRYIDANKTIIMLCNNAHPRFNDLLQFIEREVTQSEVK
jgi:CubicO group peptidase (beta-lactamase class C family)